MLSASKKHWARCEQVGTPLHEPAVQVPLLVAQSAGEAFPAATLQVPLNQMQPRGVFAAS